MWEDVSEIQKRNNLEIYGNATAWWNADLSIAFLDYHLASRASEEPVILLWDHFSGHWTEEMENNALELTSISPRSHGVSQGCADQRTSRGFDPTKT
jgi:hypothetical protein